MSSCRNTERRIASPAAQSSSQRRQLNTNQGFPHRKLGTTYRFKYQLLRLEEATANRTLLDAEEEGHRIAQLSATSVVLERRGRRVNVREPKAERSIREASPKGLAPFSAVNG